MSKTVMNVVLKIKPNCAKLQNTDSGRAQGQKQISHVSYKGNGLYMSCEINSRPIDCLVDATVSILSERVWNSLKHSYNTSLEPYTYTLSIANEENVEVKGKVTMKVTVCGFEFDLIFIVANIDRDGLLGLDFLT